jgi:DNA-directed RNA polymerase specialized sigma subunit
MYAKISEWLDIYHSSDDIQEKERVKTLIVTQMYPVIKHIARTIARRAYDPVEDLIQAGFIGLLKAIDRFDKDKNGTMSVDEIANILKSFLEYYVGVLEKEKDS